MSAALTVVTVASGTCLGFKGLACNDANSSVPTFINLGNALSTLALVITFMQLVGPAQRFRLKARGTSRWYGITALVGMFVCAAISSALRVFAGSNTVNPLKVIGYAVFWEWSSAILAFVGLTILVYSLLVPVRWTRRNSGTYAKACREALLSNDRDSLAQLARELEESKGNITEAISCKDDIVRARVGDLFAVLSSANVFFEILTEKHAPFLRSIFEVTRRAQKNTLPCGILQFISLVARQCFISDHALYQKDIEVHFPNSLDRSGIEWSDNNVSYSDYLTRNPYALNFSVNPPDTYFGFALFSNVGYVTNVLESWNGWAEEFHSTGAIIRYREAIERILWKATYDEDFTIKILTIGFGNAWATLERALILSRGSSKSCTDITTGKKIDTDAEYEVFASAIKWMKIIESNTWPPDSRRAELAACFAEFAVNLLRVRGDFPTRTSLSSPELHFWRHISSPYGPKTSSSDVTHQFRLVLFSKIGRELCNFESTTASVRWTLPTITAAVLSAHAAANLEVDAFPLREDIRGHVVQLISDFFPVLHGLNPESSRYLLPNSLMYDSDLRIIKFANQGGEMHKTFIKVKSSWAVARIYKNGKYHSIASLHFALISVLLTAERKGLLPVIKRSSIFSGTPSQSGSGAI
ncbi:hypothetical protein [Caballeronia telluris]|uniref:Uncharacterized protein n=1 Tax=Caballeronia telluris TaxID=326475 RepID=A0A158KG03_9BURK|nr:hypothetical protein [Caballeronia telluris]SAL79945.1 hypothetical protein AWB66_06151 [Caballeronia telluris]